MIDTEAIVWAYNKLNAFGVGNSNMDSAMMLDRLKDMLFSEPAPLPVEDEIRKDAERYRWLCEQDDGSDIQILNIGKWVKPAMCIALTFQEGKEQIDTYIDTGMKEQK